MAQDRCPKLQWPTVLTAHGPILRIIMRSWFSSVIWLPSWSFDLVCLLEGSNDEVLHPNGESQKDSSYVCVLWSKMTEQICETVKSGRALCGYWKDTTSGSAPVTSQAPMSLSTTFCHWVQLFWTSHEGTSQSWWSAKSEPGELILELIINFWKH